MDLKINGRNDLNVSLIEGYEYLNFLGHTNPVLLNLRAKL